MNSQPIVHLFDDAEQLARGVADTIVFAAHQSVLGRRRFRCALAGGTTPKRSYTVLSSLPHRDRFAWDRFDAWIGDERIVSATDPASNHRMILEQLIEPAGADPAALHAYDTRCGDPERAAAAYARSLAQTVETNRDGVPVLDLVLLGLGADAHTASWFPGSRFPSDCWVAVTPEPHAGYRRWTLTPTVVNAARRVLFLVSGSSKREAVERVFSDLRDPLTIPAQRVAPQSGRVVWMLDRDAAGQSLAG